MHTDHAAKVGRVSVVAFLVLGSDGSSTLNGTSLGLSTRADHANFLKARRAFDCILIGGRTANSESYVRTPGPLVIVSHRRPDLLDRNPKAHWWNSSPKEAVARARTDFGSAIAIEGGVNFLTTLIEDGLIDELRLSNTPASGGENKVIASKLMDNFEIIQKSQVDDTTFYLCSAPIITNQK